jgi:hypothetical protein
MQETGLLEQHERQRLGPKCKAAVLARHGCVGGCICQTLGTVPEQGACNHTAVGSALQLPAYLA